MLPFSKSSPVAVELKQRDSIIVKVIYHLAFRIAHFSSHIRNRRIQNPGVICRLEDSLIRQMVETVEVVEAVPIGAESRSHRKESLYSLFFKSAICNLKSTIFSMLHAPCSMHHFLLPNKTLGIVLYKTAPSA